MARSAQVTKIGREMRQQLSSMLSDVMLAAADAVEAGSPFRTGHLSSNFILTTGSPFTGVAGSPEAVSYDAQNAGKAKVMAYDVGRDGRIFLRNNVDYLHVYPGFVTEAIQGGLRAAPRGQKRRVRTALKAMATAAHRRAK